ncbi:MAG TPA: response regulator [Anaerolineaceae bacterium]|nr:response regulator [Anaerolineaceae bacterium]
MKKPVVLIVEDDRKLSTIYSLTLEETGFEIVTAADGIEAMAQLAQITPDLVLLDLHLPGIPGTQVLQHIRTEARLANVRVILATADDRLAETLEGQANMILLKPISPEQLSLLAARIVGLGRS